MTDDRRDTADGARPERHETEAERADRNLTDVIQELRVAQTGVQILFAFLISLPFLPGFPDGRTAAVVLTGALLSSAAATIAFIAPVAIHRWNFQQGRKQDVVRIAHRLAIAGLVLLAVSMGLATWLFMSALWSASVASVTVVGLLGTVAALWWAVPAAAGRRDRMAP